MYPNTFNNILIKETFVREFIKFYVKSIPFSFFENLNDNINTMQKNIKNCKGIIGTNIVTDVGLIYASLAEKQNLKVIGVQHGGHYGYLDNLTVHTEFEYYVCDYYLTWGWDKFDKNLSSCKPIKMPSVRLAQFCKNNYFNYNKLPNKEVLKVLFLPQTIFRFSYCSNGWQQLTLYLK